MSDFQGAGLNSSFKANSLSSCTGFNRLTWSVIETLPAVEADCHLAMRLIAQAIAIQNFFDQYVFGSDS